jgi:hypothetical protein
MKILTASFRAREDGTITSHYRAQEMTGQDVPVMLRKIRDDIDAELALIEGCPAVRAARAQQSGAPSA